MNRAGLPRRQFIRSLGAAALGVTAARAQAVSDSLDRTLEGLRFRGDDPPSAWALKEQYLLPDGFTYLNHASIGTVPRAVHEAHVGYLGLCETSPSLYVWGEPWRLLTEEARESAASLLGARADDVAITHNTTEGFNILANGLPLGEDDEVLFSSLNHPGASVAWRRQAELRGFHVRQFEFPVDEASGLDQEAIVSIHEAQISDRTRALVIPHVDNVIGLRHPLAGIARMARERGVRWILVDGAQSAGMIPVDLETSGVDAFACSPHKWIQSPKGLGLFWLTPELRESLPPLWHRTPDSGLAGSARQYEDYSTRAWPAVVALGDALRFQAALGEAEKERRYHALWQWMRDRVEGDPSLEWRSPVDWTVGSMIVAVRSRNHAAPALGRILGRDHRVDVRAFGGALDHIRLAPNLANPEADIDRVLELMVTTTG